MAGMAEDEQDRVRVPPVQAQSTLPRRAHGMSFGSALALMVPLLLSVTSGLITWRMFGTASESVEDLARAAFVESAGGAVNVARAHFDTARTQMRQLLGMASEEEPEEQLVRRMRVQLEANPSFSWVSYARRDGSFCGVYREGGKIFLNRSWLVGERARLEVHELGPDGARRLVRESDDHDYDPRTRDFYGSAIAAGSEVWTEPYVFFGQDEPGITLAAPHSLPGGEPIGVFTIDFGLAGLRRFVAGVRVGATGVLFLATGDGTVLAHPSVEPIVVDGASRLVRLAGSGDPVLAAFGERDATESLETFTIESGEERWLAACQSFGVAGGLTLLVGLAAPEREFVGDVHESLRDTVVISAFALGIAIVAALWFARLVSRPLRRIAADMDRVGSMQLDAEDRVRAPFREIEAMSLSLEGMKAGLRSFARFVPTELVRELVAGGKSAQLQAEVRHMTVFFSDIEGFTGISEKAHPAELVVRLAAYLSELTREIVATGGTVDKFIGDGVMAFWNAPGPSPDHARLAIRAAMRCRSRLGELALDPETRRFAFATRIGIATGEMMVGNFGTNERMNYTVIGDVPNLAARLEALNKQYGTRVLVDEAAAAAAGDRIIFRPIDIVAVMGRQGGTTVFEPLCESDAPEASTARARAERAESAFAAYRRRDFALAREGFRGCLELWPGDRASEVLAERSGQLLASPPPRDWNGVFVSIAK